MPGTQELNHLQPRRPNSLLEELFINQQISNSLTSRAKHAAEQSSCKRPREFLLPLGIRAARECCWIAFWPSHPRDPCSQAPGFQKGELCRRGQRGCCGSTSFANRPVGRSAQRCWEKAAGEETNPSDAFASQHLPPSFVQGSCSALLIPSPLPPPGIQPQAGRRGLSSARR